MLLLKAVGIGRRSDHKQKGNTSLDVQEEEIKARAKSEGYEIVKIFIDDAKSAFHYNVNEREGTRDFFQYVLDENNDIDAVFFYDESRLSRQFYDFVLFMHDKIKEQRPHVKFYSVQEPNEWDPYEIKAMMNFATAAQDSIIKSSRAIDGQKNALKRKERPGSDAPYGYMLIYPEIKEEGKRPKAFMVINREEAAIVRLIFFLTSWGHSQVKIAKYLTDTQIPSPEKNKKWESGTIDYILNNDKYLGHLPWNIRSHRNKSRKKQRGEYELIPNHHAPIVNVTLWHLAHQAIELHKSNGKNNDTQFYLRGLLHCKRCNQSLKAKNETPKKEIAKKSYCVYRCPSCKGKVNIQDLHNEVMKELKDSWNYKVIKMADNIKKLITTKKKEIMSYRKELNQNLEKILYDEQYLVSNHKKVSGNEDWDFIISISKTKTKKEIAKVDQFIEHIKLLEEESQQNKILSILDKFDIENLSKTELRTLFLTLYKRISIDFEKDQLLYVNYQYAPFTEIEQFFENILSQGT